MQLLSVVFVSVQIHTLPSAQFGDPDVQPPDSPLLVRAYWVFKHFAFAKVMPQLQLRR